MEIDECSVGKDKIDLSTVNIRHLIRHVAPSSQVFDGGFEVLDPCLDGVFEGAGTSGEVHDAQGAEGEVFVAPALEVGGFRDGDHDAAAAAHDGFGLEEAGAEEGQVREGCGVEGGRAEGRVGDDVDPDEGCDEELESLEVGDCVLFVAIVGVPVDRRERVQGLGCTFQGWHWYVDCEGRT